jgi:hypothetical protein
MVTGDVRPRSICVSDSGNATKRISFNHADLETPTTARTLAQSARTIKVRMVGSNLRNRVGLALAGLSFERLGVSGSPRIFRDLILVGRGSLLFFGK